MLQQLGFRAEERLLIIQADDFGLTQETNEAIIRLFDQQAITATTLMVPAPDAEHAVTLGLSKGIKHVGIHITLTSGEFHPYRPVFQERPLASLTTADGLFPYHSAAIERYADADEVRIEMEAQIKWALSYGLDPTHLDSHAGSIMGVGTGRDFMEAVFDLCEKYGLPFNLPSRIIEQPIFHHEQRIMFQERIASAKKRNILFIDDIVSLPYCFTPHAAYSTMKKQLIQQLKNLQPGITQLTLHPSIVTEQLKAVTACYAEREMEYRLLMDRDIKQLLEDERIILVSWKELRDLQRAL